MPHHKAAKPRPYSSPGERVWTRAATNNSQVFSTLNTVAPLTVMEALGMKFNKASPILLYEFIVALVSGICKKTSDDIYFPL